MDIGYMMVDILCLEQGFWELGALHIWLWLMAFIVKRGEATCIYCTSFLPYLEATTFTILLAFIFAALVSSASIVLGLWRKNSWLFSFLAFFLQVCWLLPLHS
jgi:hypothetical protein